MDSLLPTKKSNINKELSLHLLFIFIISLCLLIPKIFFDMVLSDRLLMQNQAVRSITTSWSQEQTITPPILVLAAQGKRLSVNAEDGSARYVVEPHKLLLLPQVTSIDIKLLGEERQRGIYSATLYRAEVSMQGSFALSDLSRLLQEPSFSGIELSSQQSYLTLLLSDASGIDEVTALTVNDRTLQPRPGQSYYGAAQYDSFIAAFRLDSSADKVQFTCRYRMRGALSFALQAFGAKVSVTAQGTQLSPSFMGRFLPLSHQSANDSFSADYVLSNIATGYAGLYLDELPDKQDIVIDIQQGRQHYAFVERLSKYALFFIALTFVTVLAFELMSCTMVSLVQYVVVGCALILFYMVLLSLSEHLSFGLSYSVSALLMSLMISLYLKGIFKSWQKCGIILLILLALYVVLYAIVNAENYALLIGTALLIIMLGVIMFLTRNLNQKIKEAQ